jgi:hypothetical protein
MEMILVDTGRWIEEHDRAVEKAGYARINVRLSAVVKANE